MEKSVNNKSGWQLLEDGPEAYEKYIVPAFSGAWAEDIVKRANLRHDYRILDLGCGTGIVSRYAYQAMGESVHITGMDINEIAINKAREICHQDASTIEWKQGSAESLPFADAEFDVVLCQQGLQYFPDRLFALTEVNRVLAPKGYVIFSVWRSLGYNPFYNALHKALERYVNEEAASALSSAYILGDATQLRELFESAEFKNTEICIVIKQMRCSSLADFLFGGVSASPFANDIFELKESKRKEMFQSIYESISDYMDDRGLAAPMESYVVSATK
jgi:ubiquinone/menaquinone biosynthesis C-methylase UbiE